MSFLAVFLTLWFLENGVQSTVDRKANNLIELNGYLGERYTVQTKDGYLLRLCRFLDDTQRSNLHRKKLPVLLVHGIIQSSADWFYTSPQESLPFILAKQGYDVWLGNTRGNTFSRRHVKFDPDVDRKEFWDFSFHELAHYDLPAMIDFVLNITSNSKLFYLGFSQGSTSCVAMLSEKLEYNNKIELFVALSFTVLSRNISNLVYKLTSPYIHQLKSYSDKFQDYEVLPHSQVFSVLIHLFCSKNSPILEICALPIYGVGGYTPNQLNKTLLSAIGVHTPSGASLKQVFHYEQLRDKFKKYDYGKKENLQRYGQKTSPEYKVSNVRVPIVIINGKEDTLSFYENIFVMEKKLKSLKSVKILAGFNHLDLLWGINATELVFKEIVNNFNEYSSVP